MAAHAARAARLTVSLLAACATLAATPASAAGCDPNVSFESCGGVTSDGGSYNGVIAIPGLRGDGGGGSGGGGGGCVDCEWTFVPACLPNGPEPGADAMCPAAATACENRGGGILMRVYVRQGGGAWQSRGTVCIGGGNPNVVTVDDVRADAGAAYRERMRPPAATISTQPRTTQVVNIPTYFTATGAQTMTSTFGPPEVRMTITATPAYVWDFGDGTTLETVSPGGPYPDGDVRHTYTSAARRTVTLTTRWRAEFTVATALGTFGPFEIGGPAVAPSTSRVVEVREARAVLIGDQAGD